LLLEFNGSESTSRAANNFSEIAKNAAAAINMTTRPEESPPLWQARHDAYWAAGAARRRRVVATDVCWRSRGFAIASPRPRRTERPQAASPMSAMSATPIPLIAVCDA